MKKAWNTINLEGGGVQSANLFLQQRMKRRSTAYLSWLAFPIGAHRSYLENQLGSLIYSALTACGIILWLSVGSLAAIITLVPLSLFALYDLYWIDGRITKLNKELRMATYLGMSATAPEGYKGRYTEENQGEYLAAYKKEKEQEVAGIQPVGSHHYKKGDRAPSFAEQESLLRELNKSRNKQNSDS